MSLSKTRNTSDHPTVWLVRVSRGFGLGLVSAELIEAREVGLKACDE